MNILQTQAEVGEDHVLHLALPKHMPTGRVEVLVVVEPLPPLPSAEERRAAALGL